MTHKCATILPTNNKALQLQRNRLIISRIHYQRFREAVVAKQHLIVHYNYQWVGGYQYETKADPRKTQCAERFCCHNKANITVGLLLSLGAATICN